MNRTISERLKAWKNSKRRKPLILTGVRQCGKTYSVEEFGKECFRNCVTVNFEKQPSYSGIFDYDYDVRRIVRELENETGSRIVPGETLLFLDEVQSCPRAVTSLKYFCEDLRELHVVCAGSLLGVALTHENISFPVGKVNRLRMYPMNFREFVNACGREDLIRTFSDWPLDREIPELYALPMKKLLKEYLIVGGMPEAVSVWLDGHSVQEVEEVQNEIIRGYEDDFSKYAPTSDLPKIRMIWDSIPVQLARENNKFIFSHVKAGKRAADLEDALKWLVDAGIIYQLHLVEKPEIPLSAFSDRNYFKVYLSDVGLLRVKSKVAPETIMNGSLNYTKYKGAFAENYVFCELVSLGREPYFWRSGNTAELDFIFDGKNTIVPVEVKAADNVQAKSYRLFCRKYRPETGFKLSLKNIGESVCEGTQTISLPLYLAWNMNEYLNISGAGQKSTIYGKSEDTEEMPAEK